MSLYRVLSATLAAGCLAALPSAAVAAPRGDDPMRTGPARIEICKYGPDTFDVYAAGASIRQDSLDFGREVCTDWRPVEPGVYDLTFAQSVASQTKVRVLAQLYVGERRPRTKVYDGGSGVVNAVARRGETVRLDLFAKRICCR